MLLTLASQHATRNQYVKNYSFAFRFEQPWGDCEVTMTCVSGHLTGVQFPSDYKNWEHPPPVSLFSAPILTTVQDVSSKASL